MYHFLQKIGIDIPLIYKYQKIQKVTKVLEKILFSAFSCNIQQQQTVALHIKIILYN